MRSCTLPFCLALLVGCQESGPASQPAPAAAAPGPSASAPKPAPAFARDAFKAPAVPIEGEPVDEQRLLPILPDQLDGYVAEGPATARRVSVPNGGALTTVKRTYKKDASTLELEVIDSLHSPNIRSIVKLSAQIETDTASVVRKPEKVGAYTAIAQWHAATSMARIGVLVDDRFIVNVNLNPASAFEPGLELARKLDLAPLAKLSAEVAAEAKAKPATAAAGASTAAPAAAPAPAAAASPTSATGAAPIPGATKPAE
jgi:hypothetical protein